MEELIRVKGLKGKQSKRKWAKNIDVSMLLDTVAQHHTSSLHETFQKPLNLLDDSASRTPLSPNRFKRNGVPIQKSKPQNNVKLRVDSLENIQDPWGKQDQVHKRKKQQNPILAVVQPLSGHSYHPSAEALSEVVDEIIDYGEEKQKKRKIIKKAISRKIVSRRRNPKVRAQQLNARERKKERQRQMQLNNPQLLWKQIRRKEKKQTKKLQQKKDKQLKQAAENATGKVRYGKNLGKIQYKYKPYLPKQQEINKKMSMVKATDTLLKEQFDGIFRRGILQPRTIKVHANKRKNIKTVIRQMDNQ